METKNSPKPSGPMGGRNKIHMPTEKVSALLQNREVLDDNEKNVEYLHDAERSYIELAKKYNFIRIACTDNNEIRSIEDIHNEVFTNIMESLNK